MWAVFASPAGKWGGFKTVLAIARVGFSALRCVSGEVLHVTVVAMAVEIREAVSSLALRPPTTTQERKSRTIDKRFRRKKRRFHAVQPRFLAYSAHLGRHAFAP